MDLTVALSVSVAVISVVNYFVMRRVLKRSRMWEDLAKKLIDEKLDLLHRGQ
ncbi:hypothetical protein GCM10011491_31020 [Brucella endophytica]|uniref:Uncharacterized protein n=1 Tax=Brucella endophytica TaxID=1963359 RepID=A0A916SID9_9HYPH|nr:hypothetical protein GCM10011491_31020 [Brucella endophytica]